MRALRVGSGALAPRCLGSAQRPKRGSPKRQDMGRKQRARQLPALCSWGKSVLGSWDCAHEARLTPQAAPCTLARRPPSPTGPRPQRNASSARSSTDRVLRTNSAGTVCFWEGGWGNSCVSSEQLPLSHQRQGCAGEPSWLLRGTGFKHFGPAKTKQSASKQKQWAGQ